MTASHVARHCAWEACYNIRDLGGYPTRDGSQTRWRALVRADDLSRLTPIGRRALLAYRIRTIVDLRSPAEVAHAPHPFAHNEPGMRGSVSQRVWRWKRADHASRKLIRSCGTPGPKTGSPSTANSTR